MTPLPQVTMHYPSTKTCYFATGGWQFTPKEKSFSFKPVPEVLPQRNQTFVTDVIHVDVVKPIPNFNLYYDGSESYDEKLPLFLAKLDANCKDQPSKITHVFWIQAPIAPVCLLRLTNITCNSGKFLVEIPKTMGIDRVWSRFKAQYVEGNLGYAIQCSTAKKEGAHDPEKHSGIITVHLENSFDLETIAKVSYRIFGIMHRLNPRYQYMLSYVTDRGTRAIFKNNTAGEALALYKLNSWSYCGSYKGHISKKIRSLQLYTDYINGFLSLRATERQELLKDKEQKFSLEYRQKLLSDYCNEQIFTHINEIIDDLELIQ